MKASCWRRDGGEEGEEGGGGVSEKMVRGLSQWTKTLSFPARVSPQRPAKESKGFQVSPSASPTSPPSPINDTMDKTPIITDEVSFKIYSTRNTCSLPRSYSNILKY